MDIPAFLSRFGPVQLFVSLLVVFVIGFVALAILLVNRTIAGFASRTEIGRGRRRTPHALARR